MTQPEQNNDPVTQDDRIVEAPHHNTDAPAFIDTAFAGELQAPGATQAPSNARLTPAPSPHADSEASASNNSRQELSRSQRALRFAATVASSNNLYTSIGNIIITANLWTGLIFQPFCALLAIANEAREKRREAGEYRNPPPRSYGFEQNALDLWNSPGVYRVALSVAYFINSLESLASVDLLFTAIYLCASLGNIGAARTLNLDYFRQLHKERGTEPPPPPSRFVSLATSPGINWSATDILIGLMTLPKLGSFGMAAACVPTTFAVTALVMPFILGARVTNSPLPLICNGFSNLGFAAVHAMFGNPAIAVACVGWGIASLLIAHKQAQHHKHSVKDKG